MRLRIKRWVEQFEAENPNARPKKEMRFLAVPTNTTGSGMRKLSRLEDDDRGLAYLGAWYLILLNTANLEEGKRGHLIRSDGTPHTAESLYDLYGFGTLETWTQAIEFFATATGWLIDEDAPAQAAQPSKVVTMPASRIEEPTIYELAADRMIDAYLKAGAEKEKVMNASVVSNALLDRLMDRPSAHHAEAIALIEENIAEMLANANNLRKILRLDNFIRSGPCLLPRTGPRRYERGSKEALIISEVQAGRMTKEQALEQGVQV